MLLYTSGEDLEHSAPQHYPAHRARVDEFHARGRLLLIGTFGDPQREGAMAVFPTRAEAEAFAAGDPFVLNGVVSRYEIRDWDEILG